VPWNIVVLLTLLTLLPSLLLAMTPFARLLVVFHFLRQALGTDRAQQSDVNRTLADSDFLSHATGDGNDL
jgi:flagellar biosynthetic protein FliP